MNHLSMFVTVNLLLISSNIISDLSCYAFNFIKSYDYSAITTIKRQLYLSS